jgi:hypothetical protein
MCIAKLTAVWILRLPSLAAGQTTAPRPVRHDSVDVLDTAPSVTGSSPATTVKPAEVKDLPSRPAGVPVDSVQVMNVSANNMTNHFNALAVQADVAGPAVGTFFGNYQRRFRADFDVIF